MSTQDASLSVSLLTAVSLLAIRVSRLLTRLCSKDSMILYSELIQRTSAARLYSDLSTVLRSYRATAYS